MTLLHIDLASGAQSAEPVTGWGGPLGALATLHQALAGLTPPQAGDPRLPLTLTTSTVSGLGAVATARCAAVGVSPLSGAVGETRAEGPFAAGLRAAGVTGVSLTGRAPRPSYLLVEDGRATRHDAGDLWGLDTRAATAQLTARHGTGAAVAVIGPAGEAGTRYASILTGGSFPLPRSGFGAVLGDRRIKAVVCRPGATPVPHDRSAVAELAEAYRLEMPGNPLAGWQYDAPGFGAWPGSGVHPGTMSVRNFAHTGASTWPGLHPDRFAPHLTSGGPGGCPGCPNDCVKSFAGAGLHQEAVAMLGPNLGLDDLAVVLAANARCQDLGLDPVSLGGTLGCLFEAADRGPLPADLAATLPGRVGYGATDRLLDLVELAATPGHPLAEGADRLADRLGLAPMTCRRVELPPFDPRVQPGLALMYAAAPTGPRYDAVEHDLDFDPVHGLPHCFDEARRLGLTVPAPASTLDVERTIVLAELWSGLDALLVCPYASTPTRPLHLDRVCALVGAVTGRAVTADDVLELGRRRLVEQQAINDLLGVAPATLPERFFTEPVQAGPHRGAVLDRDRFGAALAALRRRWHEPARTEREDSP